MIAPALLDTNTLSHIMRGEPVAAARMQAYISTHATVTISIITRYEILRGLKLKRAVVQEAAFDAFCGSNTVLPVTDAVIVRAASIYADLGSRGVTIGDADILIAATAILRGLVLVTNNTKHFAPISGLHLDNWL